MRWILLAAALLLAAIAFDLGLLVYAAYAVIGVVAFTWWLTRRWTDAVVSTRECSTDEAEIGDLVTVRNRLENSWSLPISWVLAEDVIPPETQLFKPHRLEVEGERTAIFRLAAGERREISYVMRCRRRGYYQIGPLLLETGDPFGLFRRFKIATEPTFLLVLPKPIVIESYDIASRRPIGEIRLQHRLFEDPTRIAGVRRYEQGDPFNRVHWRATARTGTLHSKIYEPSALAGATLIVDFHRESHEARHEPFRSEIAVTCASSLAHAICQLGQQVGLISNGRDAADRIREEGWRGETRSRDAATSNVAMRSSSDRLRPIVIPTGTASDRFARIQRQLGRLELSDGLTLAQLLAECQGRLPRDAAVIVILPQVDESAAIALGELARQGYFVTAVINTFEADRFARHAAPLIAVGIRCLQLRDEPSISTICRSQRSLRG